jgi:hypothetical protein
LASPLFFGIAASAAIWAYGQYGVPLVEEQIEAAEDQVEASLEEEHPGTASPSTFRMFSTSSKVGRHPCL